LDSRIEQQMAGLTAVLETLLAAHEPLLVLLADKRAALRAARYEQVSAMCQRENALVQQISEAEKLRLQRAADLTLALDPQAPEPLSLTALAARLPDPYRQRLLELRQQLAERLQRTRTEMGVARRATEVLVTHMQGLLQSIGAACGGASVYGRDGAPPRQYLAVSTFSATA
jgi:hypothetical protein